MPFNEFIRLYVILPLSEKLMGTCATHWYKQIGKMSRWSKEEINVWQNNQLQKFVQHAYNHTVYYRKLFDSLNIKPSDIKNAEDLKLLPIVNKSIINEHHDEFIPDNLNQFRYRSGKTGGTTGEPMLYFCDENTWGYVTAMKMFQWEKQDTVMVISLQLWAVLLCFRKNHLW